MEDSIDVEAAVASLEDGTDEDRVDTLEILADLSHTQPDSLIPYLDDICSFARDEDASIRSRVATILANVTRHNPSNGVARASTVRTLLTDEDPYVLMFTTAAAMNIASKSPETLLSVTDRLFELLTYTSTRASREAHSTRMRAILALGYLVDADPSLATRFDEPLVECLDDTESEVRSASVTTLTRLGLAHPEAVSTALAHLPARLDDPDPETRRHAVDAYVYFRHKQPDAIVRPGKVAPALRAAAEQVELDNEGINKVTEAYQYISKMATDSN